MRVFVRQWSLELNGTLGCQVYQGDVSVTQEIFRAEPRKWMEKNKKGCMGNVLKRK